MMGRSSRYLVSVIIVQFWASPVAADKQIEPSTSVADANTPVSAAALDGGSPVPGEGRAMPIRRAALKPSQKLVKPLRTGDRPWYTSGLLALSLVLIVIGSVAWIFKRFVPQNRITGGAAIEVLSKTYLSSKQSLALVKVADRAMLIGVTPEQISLLAVIDNPAEVATLMTRVKPARSGSKDFVNVLDQASGLFHSKQKVEEPIADSDFKTYDRTNQSLQDLAKRVRTLTETTRTC